MTMTRKGQAQATHPIPDWATLRPPVTEALLACVWVSGNCEAQDLRRGNPVLARELHVVA